MGVFYGKRKQLDNGGHIIVARRAKDSRLTDNEGNAKDPILELQLAMATSSINHEYARMEFDEAPCRERKEELDYYMDECRQKYLEARDQLKNLSPSTIEQFEADLAFQKNSTLQQYHV